MRKTNSAFCCGGMHQHFFSQGLSTFFERLAHGFVRDAVRHLLLDERVLQQMQAPAFAAIGRGAVRQGDEMCFGLPIQNTCLASFLLFVLHGCLEAVLSKPLADAVHGRQTDFDLCSDVICSDVIVGCGTSFLGFIGQ